MQAVHRHAEGVEDDCQFMLNDRKVLLAMHTKHGCHDLS